LETHTSGTIHALYVNKVSSLQELKELFAKTYQGSLPKEKGGLVAEHKDITQDTSIVNMIVVGNNIYERGRLYFNEHGVIVLLIGNIHNVFVVHHPITNQVLPNCKNLYEIKCELGKVENNLDLEEGCWYKVNSAVATDVLLYSSYGFGCDEEGYPYSELSGFKVICKMAEA